MSYASEFEIPHPASIDIDSGIAETEPRGGKAVGTGIENLLRGLR